MSTRKQSMSPVKLARVLGGMLMGAGVVHFAMPAPYDQIIPEEIPVDPRTLTYVSGAAELALGAGLLAPRTRKISAAGAAALFVAVFPANANMVRLWWHKPAVYRAIAIGRLPLQIPMIQAAVKVYRES